MTWRMYGKAFAAYDLSTVAGSAAVQPFLALDVTVVRVIKPWLILVGDPTVTSFSLSIWSDRLTSEGLHSPGIELATSTNVITKSQILTTHGNGAKEIYFEFVPYPLQAATWYNLVLQASDYSPAGDAHVAWRQGYPDPIYQAGLTIASSKINVMPMMFGLIGGDF